jgi:hypothetical protein
MSQPPSVREVRGFLNVGLSEFPEAFGTSFAVWLQHEVLSLLPVVAPSPRHPCGGRRRDDHLLLLHAPHGGAAAACAVRRRFGSDWPRRLHPEVAGEDADTRARAFRRAPTRSGISRPHNRRWLARVCRCADRSRQHRVSRRSHLTSSPAATARASLAHPLPRRGSRPHRAESNCP